VSGLAGCPEARPECRHAPAKVLLEVINGVCEIAKWLTLTACPSTALLSLVVQSAGQDAVHRAIRRPRPLQVGMDLLEAVLREHLPDLLHHLGRHLEAVPGATLDPSTLPMTYNLE
jgi:hypothetical protein